MLPEESIPEILSLMRTADVVKQNEEKWKGHSEFAANAEVYAKMVEDIFSYMTEEEKDRVLELYRKMVATESPTSE